MNNYQQQLARRVKNLPVLPAILIELNSLLTKGDVSVAAVAAVVKKDAALAIRLLRVVNSPFYAQKNPVTDLTQATVLLGVTEIANMARCLSMIDTTSAMNAWQVLDASSYWRSCLASSAIAKVIGQQIGFKTSPEFAACLHDIGICVLADSFPETYADVLNSHFNLEQTELAIFGLNNQQAKAEILKHWQIDTAAIADTLMTEGDAKTLMAIVEVANHLADIMAYAPCSRYVMVENPYQSLQMVGISLQDNDELIAELGAAARAGAYSAGRSANAGQVELHELAEAISDNALMARFYLAVDDAVLRQALQFFIRCWGFDLTENSEQAEFIVNVSHCSADGSSIIGSSLSACSLNNNTQTSRSDNHRMINIDSAIAVSHVSGETQLAINWAKVNSVLVEHLMRQYQFPSAANLSTQDLVG